ncbi:hypothetical protein QJS10_CPA01g01759 [Acorus calamus]|uniref:Uncharacterized protein n=1 Tax=Acorus calamus TaxID=4465 RepID=A0AAV9FGK4_ACOCL|nr:hypothetical protein QJS10_CPA01g01759 [Acorus calamus]
MDFMIWCYFLLLFSEAAKGFTRGRGYSGGSHGASGCCDDGAVVFRQKNYEKDVKLYWNIYQM